MLGARAGVIVAGAAMDITAAVGAAEQGQSAGRVADGAAGRQRRDIPRRLDANDNHVLIYQAFRTKNARLSFRISL